MNSGRATLALAYNYHVVARCNWTAVRCSCVHRVAYRGEIGTPVACARPSNNASRIDRNSGPLLRSSHGWSEAWFVSNKRLLPTAATLVVGWSLGELSGGVGVSKLQSSTAAAAEAKVLGIGDRQPKTCAGIGPEEEVAAPASWHFSVSLYIPAPFPWHLHARIGSGLLRSPRHHLRSLSWSRCRNRCQAKGPSKGSRLSSLVHDWSGRWVKSRACISSVV